MAEKTFQDYFGYSPIEDYKNLGSVTFGKRESLSPLVDAEIGFISQQETNKANAELAKQQNDFNLMMWNKQNEYNSPEATMKRLVEAGINPRAYQQIGQFANASTPHQAERPDYESPMGKLAKFAEKAQIDLAIKSQRLEQIKLAKDIALETSDKIRAYRELDETKRHNVANEQISQSRLAESERHNMALEAVDSISVMMKDSEFRLALAKAGITRNSDGTFNIPEGDVRLDARYRQMLIDNLEKRGLKLETEEDYLEQKKELEKINTGVKWVDSIAKLLAVIL